MVMHRVIWEIDVDAEGAEEAALTALRMMRDPNSTALCFAVKSKCGIGQHKERVQDIDLEQYAKCDSCKLVFKVPQEENLGTIHNLAERLDPGGMVPTCECRDCGALAYPVNKML